MIWNDIETDTPKRKSDHLRWVSDNTTLFYCLCLPVDDFTNEVRVACEKSRYDNTDPGKPVLLKQRDCSVDIDNLPRMSADTIKKFRNRNIAMDMRKFANWDREAIVQAKP